MSANYDIYIDVVNRKVVTSPSIGNEVNLPTLVQGESPNLRLFFLSPKNDGSSTFDILDYSTGYGFQVALCGNVAVPVGQPVGNVTPTICAAQATFSNITTPYKGVEGKLSLTDTSVATLIGGENLVNSVTLEVEVTAVADLLPVKVLDVPVQVKASVIRGTVTSTVPSGSVAVFNTATNKYEFYIDGVLVFSIP